MEYMKLQALLGLAIIFAIGCQGGINPNAANESELYSKLSKICPPEIQEFHIRTGIDTALIGIKGTKIHIPADAFSEAVFPDRTKIELIEYYDIGSMLIGNLSTTSNGKILETDGMVEVRVFHDGKEYIEELNLSVEMPGNYDNPDLVFYYANPDESRVNWELINQRLNQPDDSLSRFVPDSINPGISNMIFKMQKFRLLNRDLELDFENPSEFKIAVPEQPIVAFYYLVLENYNVIYPPVFPEKNEITIEEVPGNERGILVGLAISENDELFYASKRVMLSKQNLEFPNLRSITPEYLKLALEKEFGENIWSRPR